MNEQSFEDAVSRICEKDGDYDAEAYYFVRESLDRTVRALGREDAKDRHVTGRELCEGIRDHALEQFGPLSLLVLSQWGVFETAAPNHTSPQPRADIPLFSSFMFPFSYAGMDRIRFEGSGPPVGPLSARLGADSPSERAGSLAEPVPFRKRARKTACGGAGRVVFSAPRTRVAVPPGVPNLRPNQPPHPPRAAVPPGPHPQ